MKNRNTTLLIDYIGELKAAIAEVKATWPFIIKAMVVLPEHIHTIWQLPNDDNNYPLRWRLIKRKFTQSLLNQGILINKNQHGLYDIWQRRFWEHLIRDEADYKNHVNYIHFNPVKHAYVLQVKDWPYSTFHEFVRKKMLTEDWAGLQKSLSPPAHASVRLDSSYGERTIK